MKPSKIALLWLGGIVVATIVVVAVAARVNFGGDRLTIKVAGATNVALTMHGGELTGGLAGAGRIEYSGTVAREAVDIAGFGWVGPATGG